LIVVPARHQPSQYGNEVIVTSSYAWMAELVMGRDH